MAQFYFDSEDFSEEEKRSLADALAPVAQSDAPLSVEILFVEGKEIRRLNREQRGIDRVTDVLSFPAMEDIFQREILAEEHGDELDEEDRLFLGSIVICTERAKEQALEYGHAYERERFYLTVHGVLHCLGYDHEEEQDKLLMREKEEFVLQRMNLTRD